MQLVGKDPSTNEWMITTTVVSVIIARALDLDARIKLCARQKSENKVEFGR